MNKKWVFLFFTIVAIIESCSIAKGKQTLYFSEKIVFGGGNYNGKSLFQANSTYLITDTIDLNGKTLRFPKGVCVKLKNNGVFYNGCLIGDKTVIEGESVVFSKVTISGTWIIPVIRTSMFEDLSEDNSLKNVIALTDPSIHNTVVIEKGDYYVSAMKNADNCLIIGDNSDIVLNGDIHLRPNDYPNYSVVSIFGDNVTLKGNGGIYGDKVDHIGEIGEWGMCLTLKGNAACVENITIRDAWGDCIYITGRAKDILIKNCLLGNGRRQGISIISANNVSVIGCVITDISGTSPEYAIDVEPNERDSVDNVLVDRVKVRNCKGGFSANGRSNDSYVGKLTVKECDFEALGLPVVIATTVNDLTLKKCRIKQTEGEKVIAFDHINQLSILHNKCNYDSGIGFFIKKGARKIVNKDYWPCIISQCGSVKDKGNIGI